MKNNIEISKIKLPRKRKKAFIKAHGSTEYMAAQICNELKFEEEPIKKWTKFPEFSILRNKIIIHFNW